MRNKSWRNGAFWFHQVILIASILDNIVPLLAMANHQAYAHQHHVPRRIHLPRAVEISRKFTCRDPQSRAYNLKDLMQSLYQTPGESANQPVYVVLKRCDSHSGCCMSPDMSCTPVQSAIYYEDIEIEIWSLETNDTKRQWIRVEQHGRCVCDVTTINDRLRLDNERPNVVML